MERVERLIFLKNIDYYWTEHLSTMDHVRDSVRLRAYGQQDPLVEYKTEAHRMFQKLLGAIEASVAKSLLNVRLKDEPSKLERKPSNFSSSASFAQKDSVTQKKKNVGRNDPCPCGKTDPETGKPVKYKNCCWPKYGR